DPDADDSSPGPLLRPAAEKRSLLGAGRYAWHRHAGAPGRARSREADSPGRLRRGRRTCSSIDLRAGESVLLLLQRRACRACAAPGGTTALLQGRAGQSRADVEGENAMSRWRLVIIAALLAVPVIVLAILGSYYLWHEHLWFYVWWPLAACMAAGYILAWHWQRRRKLIASPEVTPPLIWTERDRAAWKLVKARAEAAAQLDPDSLMNFDFYTKTGQEMALELARFYHPGAADPFSQLTIPEMLAVVELASHDLAELVDR